MNLLTPRPLWRWIPTLVAMAVIGLVLRHVTVSHDGVFVALNSFAVVDWLMQESLDLLVNTLAVSQHFNTEVQREFERDFAPGETVRVKFPQEYLVRTGLAYDNSNNPINRRTTTVTCDQIFGIDFQWDSFEAALKLERGDAILSREYIKPAMAQLAQEIEDRCTKFAYQNTANIVGVLGTDPADFDSSSAAARQRLVELAAPVGKDRCMVVPPAVMRALKKSAISYFNPVQDIAKQFRDGIVGSGDGFDWYESAGLYSHTAGTWASSVTYASGATGDGITSMTVNCTNGDIFNQGDVFSTANVNPVNPRTRRKVSSTARQFAITQTVTATGATQVINFTPPMYGPGSQYQNVDALPVAGAALTLFPGTASPNGKSGTQALAIAADAFALVGVKFDNPKEGGNIQIARQLRDDETGLTIALLRYFDGDARVWKTRFDTCLGFGNLYNGNNSVRVLCA